MTNLTNQFTVFAAIDESNSKGSSTSLSSKGSSSNLRSRANAGPSEGGEVPEKYYVVQNNEMIRVKYLLIYAQKTHTHRYRD